MPNKYRNTEADLEAYAEKLREKARPALKQDLINRAFAAAQKACLEVLLAAEDDEKWAFEAEMGGKNTQQFFEPGMYLGLGEQKLWIQTAPEKKS
jgi:hypothetical protein